MSGGFFDYKQYELLNIADSIEQLRITNDSTEKDEWGYNKGRHYSEETMQRFKEAEVFLRLALIYTQRIDYLVSGDDSEESFAARLKKELHEYNPS